MSLADHVSELAETFSGELLQPGEAGYEAMRWSTSSRAARPRWARS
jgi:hypothetical protein